ncbi:beta-lactamase domain-containing protein 2-like [Amphiura filiformis]|uniref:beta-lactamase domain-containing protein 2-like n=1 Tax=Amphiura filiformis TaxID=82378 RepID=UPI003B2204B4
MGILKTSCIIIVVAVLLQYIPLLFETELPVLINGTVAPGFEDVAKVFRDNFESGLEPLGSGSAFAAYYNGEKVIDLWGGYADHEALQPWKEDTLTAAMSCTKALAALCMAMLVERGQLKYDDKVSHYWPEFAQNGKENITVRMLLNHEAGLPIVSRQLSTELFSNYEELGKVFAESTPVWKPGTARGYHMVVMAEIASQLLSRVDSKNRTVGEHFREEVAEPFDIDFYIGLPLELNYRTARFTHDDRLWSFIKPILTTYRSSRVLWGIVSGTTFWTGVYNNCGTICHFGSMNNPDVRAVEKPSSLGIGTARALAKLYDIILYSVKGPDGKPLLSQKTVHSLYDASNWEAKFDMVNGFPTKFNVGFGIYPNMKSIDIAFGHAGSGGQMSLAHPTLNLTHTYLTRNRGFFTAGDDPRWIALTDSMIKCVKKIQASKN